MNVIETRRNEEIYRKKIYTRAMYSIKRVHIMVVKDC